MKHEKEILRLAVSAGELLLKNGAEIFRVQETISRILDAFHLTNHSLYILSNGIFVTLNEGEESSHFSLRYVPVSKFHLGRIAAVNELSRQIAASADTAKLPEYEERLKHCAGLPYSAPWLQVIAGAIASGSFAYLFGGSLRDSLAAAACGLMLQLFLLFFKKDYSSRYIPTILGSLLVSILSVGMVFKFEILSLDHIIIGSIIPLVPGVAFTTAIREFFNGDYLSGSIHLIDALLTGVCIAAGVGTAVWLANLIPGGL